MAVLNRLTVLALFAVIAGSTATFPFGRIYPFPITNLLVCQVPSGFDLVPEEPPFLPLVPAPSGEVWLPRESGFRTPRFPVSRRDPDSMEPSLGELLLDFLGDDFNPEIQSPVLPSRDAPRACEIVGTIEGSAGQLLRFSEVEEWTFDEQEDTIDGLFFGARPDYIVINDTDRLADLSEGTRAVRDRLVLINQQEELCEIWTAVCPLLTEWADLGQSYFPRFFAAGLCSGKNCSHPRGQTCEPDVRDDRVSAVTVLRWDCCFNPDLLPHIAPRWECGWRRVRVPILCDCRCGCGPFIDLTRPGSTINIES